MRQIFKILAISLMFLLPACESVQKGAAIVADNPLLISIAARQGVARYIDRGETSEAKKARAEASRDVLGRALQRVNSGDIATVSGTVEFINSLIDWKSMNLSDRIILEDVLNLISIQFNEKVELDKNFKVSIQYVLQSAISVADEY